MNGPGAKKWLVWAVRCAISFGIILYLFRLIPMGKVMETLGSAQIGLVAAAIVLTQFMTYVSAAKSKVLTDEQNMSLTVWKIFEINYITQFYALFLPEILSSGVIRWHKLSKPDRKPAEALASMIFCRFTEVMILLSFGLLFWMVDGSAHAKPYLGLILAGCISAGVLTYYVGFNRKISLAVVDLLQGIGHVPKVIPEKLTKVLLATSHYQSLKRATLGKVVALNVLKDLIGITGFYLLARSLRFDVGLASIAWVRTYVLVIQLLPVSVSGIGIQEGSLIFLLGTMGFPTTSAVAFSFLLHLRKFIGGAIGGLLQAMEIVTASGKKPEVNEVG